MADRKPRLKVEEGDEPTSFSSQDGAREAGGEDGREGQGAGGAPAGAPGDGPRAGGDASPEGARSVAGATRAVGAWLTRTFPGHENAVLFGFVGFLVAVLIFIIGFWRTLFIALVVVAFVAVGQCLDGDPKILRALKRALGDGRD